MKENGFWQKSRKYPVQTTADTDYTNDIALLANSPTQAKSLLHCLKWAAGGIGLHVNTDKTDYMCFNQRDDISALKGGPLKSGQVLLPWKQCLINWESHQLATSKGMDSY